MQPLLITKPVSLTTRHLSALQPGPAKLHSCFGFFSESPVFPGNKALPGTPASAPEVLTLFDQLCPLLPVLLP